MQAWSRNIRLSGKKIALVPTMGFLHEGHLSLVDIAHRNADAVIVSIFVNPTQFGPNEDFERYPRDPERDLELCRSRNVDAVFIPEVADMYEGELTTWVAEEKLSQGLCGKSRPGHFRGVTTVVAKLFNATLPDVAVFGQKDAQQAAVLKRMVRDLNFPIEIKIGPIVREEDGLAMSSRNKYLSQDERSRALSISQSLKKAKKSIENGNRDLSVIKEQIIKEIIAAGGSIDYVETVDFECLEPVENAEGTVLIAIAAYFGATRLIDNTVVQSII
jgi:pantoate--beta-alanine ligase